MLGRVLGAIRTITWGLMPVATLLGGWIARVDVQLPYLVGGGATVVVGLFAARLFLRADAYMPVDEDVDDIEDESALQQVEEVTGSGRPAGAVVTEP